MTTKTNELIDAALDLAVAKREFEDCPDSFGLDDSGLWTEWHHRSWKPSTDWAQGGPIIEREHIAVWWDGVWHAKYDGCRPDQVQDACTPLIAAMRCYVASKLGDDVDVPEELV